MTLVDAVPELPSQAQYARFSRRLRGMFVDWVLALVVIFGAILIAASVGSAAFSRPLALVVILLFVLYEPVLVSRIGGTLGHRYANLRVVDDRTGGNVSLAKAFARAAIKAVLGWYSFLIMTATRRNQALHDLLTRSTVQIRDSTRASSSDFVTERTELSSPGMPSRIRRIAIIFIYLVLAYFVFLPLAFAFAAMLGLASRACLMNDICPGEQRLVMAAIGAIYLGIAAALIGLGWRGRLFGARRMV